MGRVIVIGGIESTYVHAQTLIGLGEEIVMFYTRSESTPGWEGIAMVDESRFPFAARVPRTVVSGSINAHVEEMRELRPERIWSLGWQQVYGAELLSICPVIGLHESLLPEGAGAMPIANVILHDCHATGVTLFELDGGVDTGPIIGQSMGLLNPRRATARALYAEAMELGGDLLYTYVPQLQAGMVRRIPQDLSRRTVYRKVDWTAWSEDRVARARTYPYA